MMEIDMIGSVIIGMAVLIVSLLIIKFMGYEVQINFIKKIKEAIDSLSSQVFGRKYYNICESYNESYISFTDFQTLLNSFYKKQCENSRVTIMLSFSLTRDDIKEISEELGIASGGKLIIYGLAEPLGAGAIIVEGNFSSKARFPFKANDVIQIWINGTPERDVLINLTGVDYNVNDQTFKPRPIEYEGICPITKNKNRGDECICSGECRADLRCEETGHCCPRGRTWNGNSCEFIHPFKILFIRLDDGSGSVDETQFKSIAKSTKELWTELTPLEKCTGTVTEITPSSICQIPSQNDLCSGSVDDSAKDKIFRDTISNIFSCAKTFGYENDYTRIIGVLNRNTVCSGSIGSMEGYTGGYNYPVVVGLNKLEEVASHEMGHTFDLCDEGYGGGYCTKDSDGKTCLSGYCTPDGGIGCEAGDYIGGSYASSCCPNRPQKDSIMCKKLSGDPCKYECTYADKFASYSYDHLEKEMSKYCE